ncbi:tyrosine-type recombinase/integrase [Gluconobacter sp. R75690]|uniref:tyrosine-type recombinase/integrase n=1 Tax=unclassified Gluconobacter TaxID=2644261 RepID=UPI00188C190B|nr:MULTISPECIES: site-specific integrase [unclassified Gluconobacter]MBF0851014.1 tyrosine-type recombinase/integrase [Gluconobacter sp. R75690]MBF0879706.1 tyrosine-type recombinase/integrase [Gluconobacter sp. R75828]
MPLKLFKRGRSETYYVRGTVKGQSVYESSGTSDPQQAEEYRAKREAELWQESIYGKRAVVTFAHAVAAYVEAEPRSEATKAYLRRLLDHFGTTRLADIDQTALDQAYRHILRDGAEASPATKVRSVLTPLRSVLEFAAIRRWCERPAFDKPRIPMSRTVYLRPEQVTDLIDNAAPHLKPLLVFLFGTGARMSEALELDWACVDLKGKRAVVWQKQGNERHIDLPPRVCESLASLPNRDGRVFRPVRARKSRNGKGREIGEAYSENGRTSGGQIKSGWSVACRKAGLPGHMRVWTPKGQEKPKSVFVPDVTPHDARHTWASWQYCLHKDLMRLKADGGWGNITTVTRYAKVMPDAYRDEIMEWLGIGG